jgi:hypothetical protein
MSKHRFLGGLSRTVGAAPTVRGPKLPPDTTSPPHLGSADDTGQGVKPPPETGERPFREPPQTPGTERGPKQPPDTGSPPVRQPPSGPGKAPKLPPVDTPPPTERPPGQDW